MLLLLHFNSPISAIVSWVSHSTYQWPPIPQHFFIIITTLCYQYTPDQLSESLTITSCTRQTDDAGPVHPICYSLCSCSYGWPQPCQFTSSPLHDCRKSSVVWQEAASRPAVCHLLTQTVWQISLPIKPSHLPHAGDRESGHPFKTLYWSHQYAEVCPLSSQYGPQHFITSDESVIPTLHWHEWGSCACASLSKSQLLMVFKSSITVSVACIA